MIRLFVGLELPPELRGRLASLGLGLPGAHWVPAENLHLTLRFIGEVNESDANDLHDALLPIRIGRFAVTIAGTGFFGSGSKPHTLWAGVEKNEALTRLHARIESALVRAGCEPERRKFTPHVTLARLSNARLERLHEFLAGHALLREELTVERFTLFSSALGRGDPVYTPEVEYPLAG